MFDKSMIYIQLNNLGNVGKEGKKKKSKESGSIFTLKLPILSNLTLVLDKCCNFYPHSIPLIHLLILTISDVSVKSSLVQ